MRQASSELNARLFLLSPILRNALLTTRQLCQEVEHHELLKVESDPVTKMPVATYTLEAFKEEQYAQKEEVCENLDRFSTSLVTIVSEACDQELEHKFPLDIKEEATHQLKGIQSPAVANKMSYTEISTKRAECRKLTNFIRLCDYLVACTKSLRLPSTKSSLRGLKL